MLTFENFFLFFLVFFDSVFLLCSWRAPRAQRGPPDSATAGGSEGVEEQETGRKNDRGGEDGREPINVWVQIWTL